MAASYGTRLGRAGAAARRVGAACGTATGGARGGELQGVAGYRGGCDNLPHCAPRGGSPRLAQAHSAPSRGNMNKLEGYLRRLETAKRIARRYRSASDPFQADRAASLYMNGVMSEDDLMGKEAVSI